MCPQELELYLFVMLNIVIWYNSAAAAQRIELKVAISVSACMLSQQLVYPRKRKLKAEVYLTS